jgi:hypothetical protein
MADHPSVPRINPTAIVLADAVRLWKAIGFSSITEDHLRSDIEAGAPVNADGTINLIHYAAWLVKQRGHSAQDNDGH